ncbi:hypothetical protein [uncultured Rikenella sp.]|uniref:hypothetical protein n=1 Tax=uncultured Rikenella sp. TaxID=368003 RepID=UPI00262649CD|nr:hypothetical protein [uncultured Rikenella sp.]
MAKSKANEWLEQDKLTLLEAWARDGLTNEQIANNMGINASTLYDYINKYDKISNALKKGKEVVDIEVENALYKNATGFWYDDVVVSTKKEVLYENGKRIKEISEPVSVTIRKFKPAETTAQIFWLKNRKPKEWRDKVVYEGETKTDGVIKDLVEALNNVKNSK